MSSVLSKYCLAPNPPWNFRWFHKLQHRTFLVSNYLQQSHKLPSLITVAFNCLPEDLSSFALLQSQSKHNPQDFHSHTTLMQQYRSPPYFSLNSQELLLIVCLPLVPLVTNSTSNRDSSIKVSIYPLCFPPCNAKLKYSYHRLFRLMLSIIPPPLQADTEYYYHRLSRLTFIAISISFLP
ncbi:hypothetical protein QL285_001344 [Trifolium repens]|nr:hypothetical protein QL285_001344 [Trifolium repens]